MIIDSHQHFWDLELPFEYGWLREAQHAPICRNYLPEDLRPHLAATGIQKTVFVQTQHNVAENRWALQLAERHEFMAGIVGWIDLASSECERQLDEFLGHPKFVGIRHVTQAEPDDNFIVRDDIVRGLKVLEKHRVPFDLLFFTQHLKHAATLAETLPELPMVIDHLSKPKIKAGLTDGWQQDLRNAAKHSNVYCKLSGMITEADWQHWKSADLRPYVQTAIEAFGPERCMFGSDWPVCELAGSYESVVSAVKEALGSISPDEERQIFGETARRFYRLHI